MPLSKLVTSGQLVEHSVNWPDSLSFGLRPRRIWVWLPQDYSKTTGLYTVLFMHDGQNVFLDQDATFGTCWQMIEAQTKQANPAIVVAVEGQNNGLTRFGEFSPWVNRNLGFWKGLEQVPAGGQADEYLSFLVEGIVPSIHQAFRCETDPSRNTLGGSSMGGFVSLYAATKYEHVFGRYMAMSTATWFHHDRLIECLSAHEFQPETRIYADIGTHETSNIEVPEFPEIYLQGNQALFALLEQKLSPSQFRKMIAEGAEHNEAAWAERLPIALPFLQG